MFEGPLQDLIDELSRLPGVGPKSAQRIAFHLLRVEPEDISRLTTALTAVRDGVSFCRICCKISLVVTGPSASQMASITSSSPSLSFFLGRVMGRSPFCCYTFV